MEKKSIDFNRIMDFTLLDARATFKDIEKLCDVAFKNNYYSVCVNPCFVKFARSYIDANFDGNIKVVCVIGFPLGANKTSTKLFEVKEAFDDGADEVDVVVNISMVKNGSFDYVKNELSKIKKVAKKKIVKAIIETCYLDENEIVKLCKICASSKIDFVKTSTGFGTQGATVENIDLIFREVKGKCKIKASGGIRSREQMIALIEHGADRIGTSRIL